MVEVWTGGGRRRGNGPLLCARVVGFLCIGGFAGVLLRALPVLSCRVGPRSVMMGRVASGVLIGVSGRARVGVVASLSIPCTMCRHSLVALLGAPPAGYEVKRGIYRLLLQ